MPGLPIQQSDINVTAGDICRAVTHDLNRAANFKRFLDRFSSAQLVSAFGFTQGDADIIKSAFGELAAVNTTFQTNRTFVDMLAGLGDV
jgi:hypothetical protein